MPHYSIIPLFQHSNPMRILRNKANPGPAGPGASPCLGTIVRNKANLPLAECPIVLLFHYSTIPVRCPLCETKPIPPGRREGQVLCGTRVMTSWARNQARQNKANSRRHADREIDGPGGQACKTKPISRGWRTGSGSGDKGRTGETNPISEGGPPETGGRSYKQSQLGEPRSRRSAPGPKRNPRRHKYCSLRAAANQSGRRTAQGNCMWALYRRGMGFQPMQHRQDADATPPHGQDARATSVPNAHMQLPWRTAPSDAARQGGRLTPRLYPLVAPAVDRGEPGR